MSEITKIDILDSKIIDERDDAARVLGRIDGQIFERLEYILGTLFKLYDGQLLNWYFEGAEEGSVGEFQYYPDDEIYSIYTEAGKTPKPMQLILKDGSEYEYEGSIPLRWLFEDFEDEIVKGKELFVIKQENKKIQTKKAKEAREQKKQEVLNKLTKEERKLLNV